MSNTVEWSPQRARAAEPNGPSMRARIRTPFCGSRPAKCSPGGCFTPRAARLATVSQRSFVHPFFARTKNTSSRPELVDASASHTDATVKGCDVNEEMAGMLMRKCCPGAHERYPDVTTRTRTVLPGMSSAWAYPGGGEYISPVIDASLCGGVAAVGSIRGRLRSLPTACGCPRVCIGRVSNGTSDGAFFPREHSSVGCTPPRKPFVFSHQTNRYERSPTHSASAAQHHHATGG
jgi:hypothetical protein